jgi:hypothetical protein
MNILDSRILLKRSTTAGVVPTIPATASHTDGTWVATDIYEGETFVNTVDKRAFVRLGSDVKEIPLQNNLIGTYQYAQRTLTSAEILALGTTPITLISAPGVGKSIWVKNVYVKLNYNTTTYSDNTIYLKINGTTDNIGELNNFLKSTITKFGNFSIFTDFLTSTTSTGFLENQALKISSNTNPTTGNGTMYILTEYQILDFTDIFFYE